MAAGFPRAAINSEELPTRGLIGHGRRFTGSYYCNVGRHRAEWRLRDETPLIIVSGESIGSTWPNLGTTFVELWASGRGCLPSAER